MSEDKKQNIEKKAEGTKNLNPNPLEKEKIEEGTSPKNAGSESTEEKTIEKLAEENETLKQKLKESEEKFLRAAAEYENFKRRNRQDLESRLKFASISLGEGFISGLDNLERAINHISQNTEKQENEQVEELIKGIQMIHQQFLKNLEDHHYIPILPKGEKFNPELHEAIGMIETDQVEEGHVAEVFKAGYQLHNRVIRPAMVQVAKPLSSKQENK